MPAIARIISRNSQITELSLNSNKIQEQGIQILSGSFSATSRLSRLSLGNTGLNGSALHCLVSSLLTSNLPIVRLYLGSVGTERSTFAALNLLIRNLKTLRDLDISSENVTHEHVTLLQAALSDSNCKLRHFRFGMNQNFTQKTYDLLKSLLASNPHLLSLVPGRCPMDLQAAWERNRKGYYLSQRNFVDAAVRLGNLYYSDGLNEGRNNLKILPADIMLLIIRSYGKNTLGMEDKDLALIALLVMQNFSRRRNLLTTRAYSSNEVAKDQTYSPELGIGKWWSQTVSQDQRLFTIFHHKKEPAAEEKNQFSKKSIGGCSVS